MKLAPSLLARIVLAAPLAALAAIAAVLAWRLQSAPEWLAARHPNLAEPFAAEGMGLFFSASALVAAAAALACGIGAACAFLPGGFALRLVRLGFWTALAAAAAYAGLVCHGLGVIGGRRLPIDGLQQDSVTLFTLGWNLIGPALLPVAAAALGLVASWRASTLAAFGHSTAAAAAGEPAAAAGDRILENIRTGGSDPRFRRSWLTSFSWHLLVIVIIPWLFTHIGCRERYAVPQGSGEEAVAAVVRVAKPVRKKKRRYVLNLASAIILSRPDVDRDSVVEEVVDKASEVAYVAERDSAQARAGGKLGKGGGTKGGWPDGVGDAPVRFLRLRHGGSGWDDGMDEASRADLNFLEAFARMTGLKVARTSEARSVAELRNFDKGYAPPFVYLTGSGPLHLGPGDVKILREYLLGGGMLFADAGSPVFHESFRAVMGAVFPDRPMVTIADDDPLFQTPYAFPNGAPPLWHHGGNRALGIKHQQRWAVFYHPGDINDAWKTGHSGMSRDLADASYKLGVNVVYYAFTHYLEMTRKDRK